MKIRVTFSPQAREQALRRARWWREHRPAAARQFAFELRSVITLLAASPSLGIAYPHAKVAGVRRLLLSSTQDHVYYVYDEVAATVEVLAIWGAVRRRGPRLGGRAP